MDLDALDAIDVHVHVEQDSHGCFALDQELLDASAKYFQRRPGPHPDPGVDRRALPRAAHGRGGVHRRRARRHRAPAAVQRGDRRPGRRARRRADPVRLGRPARGQAPPSPGPGGWSTEHGVRGFKFHPSLQAFEPNDPRYYPLYEALQELGVPALFHTGQTGIGAGPARRARHQAALLRPDAARRRRRRLPAPHDRHGAPVGAVAGRGHLDRHPQGQRLHRPVRLVAEVLPAAARPGGERPAQAQGAVRLRLPGHHPRPLARRLRRSSTSRTRSGR